jgi:hypothetical protein
MSTILTSQHIGISNSNFLLTSTISSGTYSLRFINVASGIYEILISNFLDGESWLGYVNWYNISNPFSVVATTFSNSIGTTTTPSTGTLTFTGLINGRTYWITIRYVGRNYT